MFKKRRQNEISGTTNLLLNIMFLLITVACIAPVLLVLAISVSDEASIRMNGYQFWPQVFSTKGYEFIPSWCQSKIRSGS